MPAALLSPSLIFSKPVTKTRLQIFPFPAKHLSNFPRHLPRMSTKSNSYPQTQNGTSSLSSLAPLEAILFDIDGTLCDSDPLHYYSFREMLQQVGFNGGEPISEEFFSQNISGGHNDELCHVLLPDWEFENAMKFMDDKEAIFRRLAKEKLQPVNGLNKLCKWIEERGLQRAAVTNAPRPNAELMVSILGLEDFFKTVIIGGECERAKPFPDPYLKGLHLLEASPKHAFAFEDSVSGIKAGVAAGIPVVGLATRNPENLLAEAGASLVIKDFNDPKLWAVLEELDNKIFFPHEGKLVEFMKHHNLAQHTDILSAFGYETFKEWVANFPLKTWLVSMAYLKN